MAKQMAVGARNEPALRDEFECEAGRLARSAGDCDLAEGIMRLRALIELAEALSTEALLDLAAIAASTVERSQ